MSIAIEKLKLHIWIGPGPGTRPRAFWLARAGPVSSQVRGCQLYPTSGLTHCHATMTAGATAEGRQPASPAAAMSPQQQALAANQKSQRAAAARIAAATAELGRLQAEEMNLRRQVNATLPIFRLLDHDDIRANVMRAEYHSVLSLWRLRGVSRVWRKWADDVLAGLPRVVAISGTIKADLDAIEFEDMNDLEEMEPFTGTREVESLALHSMVWSKDTAVPALPVSRACHSACVLQDGRVVVAGGWKNETDQGGRPGTAEIWNPNADQWESLPDLPEKRWWGAAVAVSNRVVLLGGFCQTEPTFKTTTSVLSLELDQSASPGAGWISLQPMSQARRGLAAVVLPCGSVFVAGGQDDDGNLVSTAEVYNPEADTWSALPSMAYPRSCHTCAVLPSGNVVVLGGNNNDITDVYDAGAPIGEVFDQTKGTWVPIATTGLDLQTLEEAKAVCVLGGLILAGGLIHPDLNGLDDDNDASPYLFDEFTGRWFRLPHEMVAHRRSTQLVMVQ